MSPFSLESIYTWYRNLLSHPKYRWWVIVGTLVYLISPIDLLPDVIPVVGQIDDTLLIVLLVTEVAKLLRDRNKTVKRKQTSPTSAAEPVTVDAVEVE